MATRIRVRKGDTEVEYEGSERFLKTELASLLRAASTLPSERSRQGQRAVARSAGLRKRGAESGDAAVGRRHSGGGAPSSATAEIVAKIGYKHGTDLVLAACAQLGLRLGRQFFPRAALLAEMKTATEYYHTTDDRKNLSRYLKRLIKDGLVSERSPNVYTLTAAARKELGRLLAG